MRLRLQDAWRVTLPYILVILALGASGLLISIPIAFFLASTNDCHGFWCCDGNANVYLQGVDPTPSQWSLDYLFVVTLGWGHLTYAQAKAIDEVWNVVVGRGGQVLASLLLYRVFRLYATNTLTRQPAPYRTALALEYSPSSLDSLQQYIKESRPFAGRKAYSIFAAVMLIVSAGFVLALPTWLSAVTGYSAHAVPMFPWTNGTYLPSEKLQGCWVVLENATRVGLNDETCVPGSGDLYDAVWDCESLHILSASPWSKCYTSFDN
jgi:hypothetical protein